MEPTADKIMTENDQCLFFQFTFHSAILFISQSSHPLMSLKLIVKYEKYVGN